MVHLAVENLGHLAESRAVWLIGGGEMQSFLAAAARESGYRLVVTDRNSSCYLSAEADYFAPIDIFDIDGHLKLAAELDQGGLKVAAVVASGIDAPETMARLARFFGLVGVDPAIARLVSNKAHFRSWMSSNGFETPKFRTVDEPSVSSASELAAQVGYPLIVKNTDSSGSRGTKIFSTPDRVGVSEAVRSAIQVSRAKTALIEALWVGSEHTVEALIDREGTFHECFITDREFTFQNSHPVETGLVSPSQLSKELQSQMYELAREVSSKLGIDFGIVKIDAILTNSGPRIIEMTTRQSGGFDPQVLVPAATGVDVPSLTIAAFSGQALKEGSYAPQVSRVAVSGSPWPNPGEIVRISGLDEARALPGVEGVFIRAKVGDLVDAYDDCTKRVAIAVCSGSSLVEAKDNLNRVLAVLNIETKPLKPDTH